MKITFKRFFVGFFIGGSLLLLVVFLKTNVHKTQAELKPQTLQASVYSQLDKEQYEKKMRDLAHISEKPVGDTPTKKVKPIIWPAPILYPNNGAILPFNRIVAYYGNFYSKNMGILGAFDDKTVIAKLNTEVKKWEVADPQTPVIPAIHYIAIVAQGTPSDNKKYISHMPKAQIQKALDMSRQINGLLFLDVQLGQSNVAKEIPSLEAYLKDPKVHLGIDPEFSMKNGKKPGSVIGTLDAHDINTVITYLSDLVTKNNLPPKILVIHRFTGPMITNIKHIKPTPQVQVVIDMDGWGTPEHKIDTYKKVAYHDPVEFTGFKLFYKNDTTRSKSRLMKPEEVLTLTPSPIYIQYQ
jgi:hypothetical protein